jgi:hypothetical protein
MTAVEGDDDGTLGQQIGQADQVTCFVRQHERRHRIASLRGVFTGVVPVQACDEPIDHSFRSWTNPSYGFDEQCKTLVHRPFEVAGLLERLL